MKKKSFVTFKDKKDWDVFTKDMGNISIKEQDFSNNNNKSNKVQKIDLHGFSLIEANKKVKKFIIESFNNGYKKLLVVTGKGLRSKSHNNPYISEKLSVLKYSVPEYIRNEESIRDKIKKISAANIRDGGEGAIYILLKKNRLQNKF